MESVPFQEAPTIQQGSFRFPDNCPDADCDFLVTYQVSGDNRVVFQLRGRGNWAGVGFSEDNQMVSNQTVEWCGRKVLHSHANLAVVKMLSKSWS